MKYWTGDEILERDVLEGEAIFDRTNPHPAYRGVKLKSDGTDCLYEAEIIPGTARVESIIDPTTFNDVVGKVVDIHYRRWNDDTNQWDVMTMASLLASWGYNDIPTNKKIKAQSAFDRAMKGI